MRIQSNIPLSPIFQVKANLSLNDQFKDAIENLDFKKAAELIRDGANPIQDIDLSIDLFSHIFISGTKIYEDTFDLIGSQFPLFSNLENTNNEIDSNSELNEFKDHLNNVKQSLAQNSWNYSLTPEERLLLLKFEYIKSNEQEVLFYLLTLYLNNEDLLSALCFKGFKIQDFFEHALDENSKRSFSSSYCPFALPFLSNILTMHTALALKDESHFETLKSFGLLNKLLFKDEDFDDICGFYNLVLPLFMLEVGEYAPEGDSLKNYPLFEIIELPRHVENYLIENLDNLLAEDPYRLFFLALRLRNSTILDFLKNEKKSFLLNIYKTLPSLLVGIHSDCNDSYSVVPQESIDNRIKMFKKINSDFEETKRWLESQGLPVLPNYLTDKN